MTDKTEKFCSDCRHAIGPAKADLGLFPSCGRKLKVVVSLVDGGIDRRGRELDCLRERYGWRLFGHCGVHGRYWEPKQWPK